MFRGGIWWRGVVKLAAALAILSVVVPAGAQSPLPVFDPAIISLLSFRPGSNDTLLLATSDSQGHLQVHLVRLVAEGKPVLTRTLPGSFSAAAWLDEAHVITSGVDSKLESWPLVGESPALLAMLPEPILGIGVGPSSRALALRLAQTLRLYGVDGRPNGPTITLGRPTRPSDTCPPEGIDRNPVFSPDERLIVFSGLCGDLRVIGRDGGRLMHADLARPFVKRHIFAADGKTLLVAYGDGPGTADAWPIVPGRLGTPRPFPAPSSDDEVDFAPLPGGFTVLTTDRVRFLGPEGAPLRADLPLAKPGRVAASADGTRIAIAAGEGLVLLDGEGRRLVVRPFADFGMPLATAPVAAGTQIASLSREGQLRLWKLDGTEARAPLEVWSAAAPSSASPSPASPSADSARKGRLLVSPNGRRLGVLAPDGQFEVFDESWNRVGRPIRFPPDANGQARAATLLLDDRILRPLPDGSGFLLLGFDGRMLGRMAYGDQQKISVEAAATRAGVIAVYATDGRLALWSTDGQPIRQRKVETAGILRPTLDISADGRTVVLHDNPIRVPPHLLVWHFGDRPGDRDTLESRDGLFGGLLADGSVLRISRGRLALDAADGTVRTIPVVEAESVEAVSADGKLALVAKNAVVRPVKLLPDRP